MGKATDNDGASGSDTGLLTPVTTLEDLLEGGEPVPSVFDNPVDDDPLGTAGDDEANADRSTADGDGSGDTSGDGDNTAQDSTGDTGSDAPGDGPTVMVQTDSGPQMVTQAVATYMNRLMGNQGDENRLRNENSQLRRDLDDQQVINRRDAGQQSQSQADALDVQFPDEVNQVINDFDSLVTQHVDPALQGKFRAIFKPMANQIATTLDARYNSYFQEIVQAIQGLEDGQDTSTKSLGEIRLERSVAAAVSQSGEKVAPAVVIQAMSVIRKHELSAGTTAAELDSKFGQEILLQRAIQGAKNIAGKKSVDNGTATDDNDIGGQELNDLLESSGGNARKLLSALNAKLNRPGSVNRRIGRSSAATEANSANADRNRRPTTIDDDNERAYRTFFPRSR